MKPSRRSRITYMCGWGPRIKKQLKKKNIEIYKSIEHGILYEQPSLTRYVYIAIAIHKKKIVGFWNFHKKNKQIGSCVTIVKPEYAKLGIATKLWELGLQKYGIKYVKANIASDRGHTLICKLKESFPHIHWETVGIINKRSGIDLRKRKSKNVERRS